MEGIKDIDYYHKFDYLPASLFEDIILNDGVKLDDKEDSKKGSSIGTTIDYLCRYLHTKDKNIVWQSVLEQGERSIKFKNQNQNNHFADNNIEMLSKVEVLLELVNNLTYESVQAAFKLTMFMNASKTISQYSFDLNIDEDYLTTEETNNIIIMTKRVLLLWNKFGTPKEIGYMFKESIDGAAVGGVELDFYTDDTLWDIKTIRGNPKSKKNYRTQIINYYLVGLHSEKRDDFKNIKYLAFFNPRTNVINRVLISDIPIKNIHLYEDNFIHYLVDEDKKVPEKGINALLRIFDKKYIDKEIDKYQHTEYTKMIKENRTVSGYVKPLKEEKKSEENIYNKERSIMNNLDIQELRNNIDIKSDTFSSNGFKIENYNVVGTSDSLYFIFEIESIENKTKKDNFDLKINLYDNNKIIVATNYERIYMERFTDYDTFEIKFWDILENIKYAKVYLTKV